MSEITVELRVISPRHEYFEEFAGIMIAWKRCKDTKYSSYYMEDRESSTTVYPARDESDFLDFPDENFMQLFETFQNALEAVNRGKIWDGPYQWRLDRWISRKGW